jgi:hypothetical protein
MARKKSTKQKKLAKMSTKGSPAAPADTDEGYTAWVKSKPVLAKRERRSDRLPSVDITDAIEQARLRFGSFGEERSKLEEYFSKKVTKVLNQAISRIDIDCAALLYVNARYKRESSDAEGAAKEQMTALIDEGIGLHTIAMHWLPVLEAASLITPEMAQRTRAGSGRLDAAEDIWVLSGHFKKSWRSLEPLQDGLKGDKKSLRLTKANIKRMRVAGSTLSDVLTGKKGEPPEPSIDWRDQLIRTYELLEDDYNVFREAATFYLRWNKRYDEAAEITTLKSMVQSVAQPSRPKPRTETVKTDTAEETRPPQ